MKKVNLLLMGLFFMGLVLSCSKTADEVLVDDQIAPYKVVTITESGDNCTDIFAGQNMLAGSVCLADVDTDGDGDVDALEVTYSTTGDWVLLEVHFVVSKTYKGIPMTKHGNLIPGQFPHKFSNLGGVTEFTFNVPFTTFGFDCDPDETLYAAAHSVVAKPNNAGGYYSQETGWGFGDGQPGKSWGWVFSFQIDCDDNGDGGEKKCETAFAYGANSATCFTDLTELTANRWGWTNGPLSASTDTYTFDIYAGAGQCDVTKGAKVGTLSVVYLGGTANVTYQMFSGYTMDEIHLYAGNERLPKKDGDYTVAPGQYPIVDDGLGGISTKTYAIENLVGDVYVVAHAVVCWNN
jgi:hypothetical protein